MIYDVIIIGAGPAGLAAATYASRSQLSTLTFEKGLYGGQIVLTNEVENYPGFEESISGFDLVDKMKKQAQKFGTIFKEEDVAELSLSEKIKIVKTNSAEYQSKTIIIATGANPRKMKVKGEAKYTGRGVSYCATCDGALYRNKTVAVVGGGDSAIEEALFLTKFAKEVFIIHRRDKLRANKILQERAFNNPKITLIWNSIVEEVKGEQFVQSIELYDKVKEEKFSQKVDGVFVYVGILPANSLFKSLLDLDENGFVKVNADTETNLEGVYAAGDINSKTLRQVVTATSDGAVAAFVAEKFISENE